MNVKNLEAKLPYTVKFFLIKTKADIENQLSVYCRVIVNRTKTDFSMDITVDAADWDESLGCFKGTSKQLHYLNFKLSEAEGKLQEVYYELERQKVHVMASMMKDGYRGKPLQKKQYSLLVFLDEFIEEAKSKPQVYTLPTIAHYYALKSHLESFFKGIRIKDIQLENVSRNMIDRFENWLLSWEHPVLKRPMNRNTANKYLTKLKVVINNAIRKEIIIKNPFQGFMIKAIRGKKVFLTEEELAIIKNHALGNNLSLMRVRDMFFFSVYTGLRFSDSMSLKANAVVRGGDGNLWITIDQLKTKEALHIPLLKPAEYIYNKYEENRIKTGHILPRISNQKLNLYLKEIGKLAGIQKTLTYHVARHTFATTITMEKNVDIKTVSKWLGHSSIKTTEVYAQVTKAHISQTAQRLNDGMDDENSKKKKHKTKG